jgi:predicted secreted hydrolase
MLRFAFKPSKNIELVAGILFLCLFTVYKPAVADENNYFAVTGPCNLIFPQDHGSHPGYRTEWWYYTGNLHSENGSRYGFQLTFFRSQISPPGAEKDWPKPPSRWRTQQVYLAHAAVSDLTGNEYRYKQSISRSAVGIAGIIQEKPELVTISLKNWSVTISPEFHHLKVANGSLAFELRLIPAKGPVLHGDSGYSRKGTSQQAVTTHSPV